MDTRLISVDPLDNLKALYEEVACMMREGAIVALPTETVYGLGADAFNAEAVAAVYEAKQRPSFDPLICHLASARQLKQVAIISEELSELVEQLTKQFWPGPLTLVLPKQDCIPDIVTSGLATVACRVPAHEVMRGVAKALGHPIAAPSANRFGRISPTSAAAVMKELEGRIPLIIDAGACSEGLESTILAPCIDEKGKPAVHLLREGPIAREQLRKICRVIRPKKLGAHAAAQLKEQQQQGNEEQQQGNVVSPGQLASHYAPSKPLYLHSPRETFTPEEDVRYGLISYQGESPLASLDCWEELMPLSPGNGRLAEAAVRLFAVMRAMDECEHVDVIIAEELPETGLGYAMMDRLRRAAHGSQQ